MLHDTHRIHLASSRPTAFALPGCPVQRLKPEFCLQHRFCWGGKYAVLSTTNTTKTRADAAVVYHGSLITTGDVKAIQRPILFLQSDPAKDPYFNTTFYNQVKTVLADKKFKGQSAAITFYPGQLHGYALRGNDADAKVAAAAQDAFAKGASFLMSGGKMMQTKVTASATATVTVKSG